MSFHVAISDDGKYITNKANVPVTLELAVQMAEQTARHIEDTGIQRVLVDLRGVSSVMSTFDDYKYAYTEIPRLGIPRGVYVALLTDPGDTTHEFMPIVSQNAGYTLQIFHTIELATEWLLEQGSS